MSKDKVLVRVTKFKDDELAHFGTKGMHWGVRRYQNTDGSLTPEGKRRYGYEGTKSNISKNDIHNYTKSPKLTARVLNTLDRHRARQLDSSMNEYKKAYKSQDHIFSRSNSAYKHMQKARAYESNVKDIDKVSKQVFDQAVKKGYDVNMSNVDRRVIQKGESIALSVIASAVLLPTTGYFVPGIATHKIPGTKYKVKQSNLQKAHEYYDKYERLKSRNYGKARKALDKYVELEDKAYGVKSK